MGVKKRKKRKRGECFGGKRGIRKSKNNEISIEEAEKYFKKEPFEEMGYAKLDTHREIRSGFAEVIFCARKADEHLLKIFTRLYEQDGEVFGTRASEHQYELIREKFPEVVYDPLSHILKIEKKTRSGSAKSPSARLEPRIFPLPRRRRRPQNTLVQTLRVSTMSV